MFDASVHQYFPAFSFLYRYITWYIIYICIIVYIYNMYIYINCVYIICIYICIYIYYIERYIECVRNILKISKLSVQQIWLNLNQLFSVQLGVPVKLVPPLSLANAPVAASWRSQLGQCKPSLEHFFVGNMELSWTGGTQNWMVNIEYMYSITMDINSNFS